MIATTSISVSASVHFHLVFVKLTSASIIIPVSLYQLELEFNKFFSPFRFCFWHIRTHAVRSFASTQNFDFNDPKTKPSNGSVCVCVSVDVTNNRSTQSHNYC